MSTHGKYRIFLSVLLLVSPGTDFAQQKEKDPQGYKGKKWTVAPKAVDKDGKSIALTAVEFRFDKQTRPPIGCLTDEKVNFGNILQCHIVLPANVAGGVVQLDYRCDSTNPLGPCGHTVQCPAGGVCGPNHLGPTTPLNLPIDKPRDLVWWGWTDDGNHVPLVFVAYAQ